MARRLIGYGITNSSGVAKLDHLVDGTALAHSYTGVGAGKINIVAESGNLQSEPYVLTDAIVFDNNSTDTTSKYYINSTDGTSKEYDTDKIKITCGSNNTRNYIYYRTQDNSGVLSQLQGKTVKFEVELSNLQSKTIQLRIRSVVDGSNVENTAVNISTDGVAVSNSAEIDANATSVVFMINPSSWSENDIFYINNFKVYVA